MIVGSTITGDLNIFAAQNKLIMILFEAKERPILDEDLLIAQRDRIK